MSTFPSVSPTYKVCDNVMFLFCFVSFHFHLNERSDHSTNHPFHLFCLNLSGETMTSMQVWSCSLRLAAHALVRIRCFCTSQMTRDAHQAYIRNVSIVFNSISIMCANGLQATLVSQAQPLPHLHYFAYWCHDVSNNGAQEQQQWRHGAEQ